MQCVSKCTETLSSPRCWRVSWSCFSFSQSSFLTAASKMQTNWISPCTRTQMRVTPGKRADGYWWGRWRAASVLFIMCVMCLCCSTWSAFMTAFCFPLSRSLNQTDCPMLEIILERGPWNATTFASRLTQHVLRHCGCGKRLTAMFGVCLGIMWECWTSRPCRWRCTVLSSLTCNLKYQVNKPNNNHHHVLIAIMNLTLKESTYPKLESIIKNNHHIFWDENVFDLRLFLVFCSLAMSSFIRRDNRERKTSGHYSDLQRQGKIVCPEKTELSWE